MLHIGVMGYVIIFFLILSLPLESCSVKLATLRSLVGLAGGHSVEIIFWKVKNVQYCSMRTAHLFDISELLLSQSAGPE